MKQHPRLKEDQKRNALCCAIQDLKETHKPHAHSISISRLQPNKTNSKIYIFSEILAPYRSPPSKKLPFFHQPPEQLLLLAKKQSTERRAKASVGFVRKMQGVLAQVWPAAVGSPVWGRKTSGVSGLAELSRYQCHKYPQVASLKKQKRLGSQLERSVANLSSHPGGLRYVVCVCCGICVFAPVSFLQKEDPIVKPLDFPGFFFPSPQPPTNAPRCQGLNDVMDEPSRPHGRQISRESSKGNEQNILGTSAAAAPVSCEESLLESRKKERQTKSGSLSVGCFLGLTY